MNVIEIQGYGGPQVLVPATRPDPIAGVGELLIRVSASGINRPDVLQRTGLYPVPPGASDIPGLEVAGVVVSGDAAAMAAAGLSVGDRVCALVSGGGYAALCVAPVGQCLPIPKGLTDVEAASLPETFFTVWSNVFDRGRLQAGETLLVQGGASGKLRRIGSISVKVREGQSMKVAEDNIKDLLRQRFKVQPGAEDPFSVRNLTEMLRAQEESSRVMTLLLATVAGISLVIGGIGIMNIMLVSVTERTREIGLRMAVGARGRDILAQFLIEAITLSLVGGALGVVLGAVATWLIGTLAGWQVSLSPGAVLLAVGFSGLVGIFFGYYPARRASQMLPIAALRHE